jgi:hypothetical protein
MKYCAFIILGGLLGLLYGCGTAGSVIDSLSNNTSGDVIRGVKLQTGVDMTSGSPVPSVTFTMGSLARKGKADRVVIVIDNNATDIVSENYHVDTTYENVGANTEHPRQLLTKEIRQPVDKQLEGGISVEQDNSFSISLTSGNPLNLGGKTKISIGNTTPKTTVNPNP